VDVDTFSNISDSKIAINPKVMATFSMAINFNCPIQPEVYSMRLSTVAGAQNKSAA